MVLMAAKELTTPKIPRLARRGKITAYPELEIQRLYELGQDNGWDTPSIVREAVREALLMRKDQLTKKAEEIEE
jgi:hypothetical protein